MTKTPHHTIRAPDELWLPFVAKCEANGTTASDVLRQAIDAYMAKTECEDDGR